MAENGKFWSVSEKVASSVGAHVDFDTFDTFDHF